MRELERRFDRLEFKHGSPGCVRGAARWAHDADSLPSNVMSFKDQPEIN
jgi:hypothetical protein